MPNKEEMSRIGKSNSRRGKTLERRIANLLTEWTGHEFRRRRVEGRESTVIERESTADVIPVNKQSIFSIEVKNASGFSLDALLNTPKITKFTEWWHQATYDASLMTKLLNNKIYPLLFFKPIPSWDWVAFPTDALKKLKPNISITIDQNHRSLKGQVWFTALQFDGFEITGEISHNISHSKKNCQEIPLHLDSLYMCRWTTFKENIDPSSIFM